MTTTSTNQTELTKQLSNEAVAHQLDTIAELLETQNANSFRVQAYRNAAETLRNLKQPVHEILMAEGIEGLRRLPGIGQSLADSITQLAESGDLPLLERLRGEAQPGRVLATVPGIGAELASRIHKQLSIETLSDLLTAAYDGRLGQVPGFGARRVRAIREVLTGRLRRPQPAVRTQSRPPTELPPVEELLDVDREYRAQVKTGNLPRLAPRRFNPTGEAWLPVLYTKRGSTPYTALYSNTARAHELAMTHDWVVIYRDPQNRVGQWTVVTSQYGPLRGKRVVRGHEKECAAYYAAQAEAA